MQSPSDQQPPEPPRGRSRQELIESLEGALAEWQSPAPELSDLSPEKQRAIEALSLEASAALDAMLSRLRSEEQHEK